uniref:(northern house mosquito) hypothetical protein n=1 Tax=Culex pipiens TaxID=7175 RepID=A0A8D8HWP1_CULPI
MLLGILLKVRLLKSGSLSVFLSSSTLPGGDLILLTTLTAYGMSGKGPRIGHRMKHALYLRFQFSRMILTRAITEADRYRVVFSPVLYQNRHHTFSGPRVLVAPMTRTSRPSRRS